MHSLKPSGDNIAQEFLRLMGGQKLVKSASTDDPIAVATALSVQGDQVEASNEEDIGSLENTQDWANLVQEALAGPEKEAIAQVNSADDNLEDNFEDFDFDGMLTDANLDQLAPGFDAIDEAISDAADDLDFDHTASEKRVLEGLSKISGSLRAKGEAFAADVVEATAISIKGDLRKEAGRRGYIVSELKKLASEFYSSEDPLAGDMVQVTINKLGGFDDMFAKNIAPDGGLDRSKFAKAPADADNKQKKSVAIAHVSKVEKMAVGKSGKDLMDFYQSYGISGEPGKKYAVEFQDKSSVTVMQSEL